MCGNKKTWNEKFKMSLNELERKMGTESTGKTDGSEKVKSKKKSRGQKKNAAASDGYKSKAEWKKASFRQEVMMRAVMSAAFLLTTVALIQGIAKVLPDSITVSNSVNGRELPIYCVETDKKQVALSFDAAWGNRKLR